jgi:hypothetical protein
MFHNAICMWQKKFLDPVFSDNVHWGSDGGEEESDRHMYICIYSYIENGVDFSFFEFFFIISLFFLNLNLSFGYEISLTSDS